MLRAKIGAGEADAWLAEREALRSRVGQTTTVVATKPRDACGKGDSAPIRNGFA